MWIRSQPTNMLNLVELTSWIELHRNNIWWQLLHEAIEAYGIEVSGLQLPGAHLIDWLAEWGREVRQETDRLASADNAPCQGLEFQHVGVLDGGWNRNGRGSDPAESPKTVLCGHDAGKANLGAGTS